jgi:hypothetical protein
LADSKPINRLVVYKIYLELGPGAIWQEGDVIYWDVPEQLVDILYLWESGENVLGVRVSDDVINTNISTLRGIEYTYYERE